MFKRRDDYLMQIDVEVDYSPIERLVQEGELDADDAMAYGLQSLVRHVERTAKEAVQATGQRWKGVGPRSDASGEWPSVEVQFKGDPDGARAAFELWGKKVDDLGGTKRILRAMLRGSDGTHLQYMDDELETEYKEAFDALPSDYQEKIDRLMDPDAR